MKAIVWIVEYRASMQGNERWVRLKRARTQDIAQKYAAQYSREHPNATLRIRRATETVDTRMGYSQHELDSGNI